ncbi:MAG: DUF3124 domain-containing protein [Proteobacteria bacterium]|nr:DUF3124 domain-containing protein [Pseudomonadota bacterium]
MRLYRSSVSAVLLGLYALACTSATAGDPPSPSRGQLLYVPVYSEVPYGDRGRTLNLAATLSIRNTDPEHSIEVRRADYHDAQGRTVRRYLMEPVTLAPLASTRVVVTESDRTGGVSASFLVEWTATKPVSPPLVETVMVSTASSQGISLTGQSQVVREVGP